MKHRSKIERDPNLLPTWIYGVRLAVEGEAEGILIVTTLLGMRIFGGPITDQRLTEYDATESAQPFPLPFKSLSDLSTPPRLGFPEGVEYTAIKLEHQSTNGLPYVIHEFYPDRSDGITPPPRYMPRMRYHPSRLAHTK